MKYEVISVKYEVCPGNKRSAREIDEFIQFMSMPDLYKVCPASTKYTWTEKKQGIVYTQEIQGMPRKNKVCPGSTNYAYEIQGMPRKDKVCSGNTRYSVYP